MYTNVAIDRGYRNLVGKIVMNKGEDALAVFKWFVPTQSSKGKCPAEVQLSPRRRKSPAGGYAGCDSVAKDRRVFAFLSSGKQPSSCDWVLYGTPGRVCVFSIASCFQ